MRFWAGPTVSISLLDVEAKGTLTTGTGDGVAFGFGGVIGADFFAGPTTDIGIEGGYRFSGYSFEPDGGGNDVDFSGGDLFLKANVIFRIGK